MKLRYAITSIMGLFIVLTFQAQTTLEVQHNVELLK